MERANPIIVLLGFIAIILVFAVANLIPDGLYVAKHEGDVLHLLDIIGRMLVGQVPHQDFLTPIGALAFYPIVWSVGDSGGIAQGYAVAQVGVLLAIAPAA